MTDYLHRNGWLPYRDWYAHPWEPIMMQPHDGRWLAIDAAGAMVVADTERAAYLALRGRTC